MPHLCIYLTTSEMKHLIIQDTLTWANGVLIRDVPLKTTCKCIYLLLDDLVVDAVFLPVVLGGQPLV